MLMVNLGIEGEINSYNFGSAVSAVAGHMEGGSISNIKSDAIVHVEGTTEVSSRRLCSALTKQ
jgi:hypothetical protein